MPDLSDLAPRRAIVLIHGMERTERDQRRDMLVENLENAVRGVTVTETEVFEIHGDTGVRMRVVDESASPPVESRVDVFEAYWADMIPEATGGNPLARIWNGLKLVVYWFFSGVWRAFGVSRHLTLGLLLSGVLLLLWYFTVVVVAAIAISTADASDGGTGFLAGTVFGGLVSDIAKEIAQLGNWAYWTALVGALGALGADRVAEIATITKAYLSDQPDASGVGLRARIGRRVLTVLRNVYDEGYPEIYVVAHSFGGAIAADVLADYRNPEQLQRTTLVTWGSPLAVLIRRSPRTAAAVTALIAGKPLAGWQDFASGRDWLSTHVPGLGKTGEYATTKLSLDAFWLDGMFGRTHQDYYRTARVLEPLIA